MQYQRFYTAISTLLQPTVTQVVTKTKKLPCPIPVPYSRMQRLLKRTDHIHEGLSYGISLFHRVSF